MERTLILIKPDARKKRLTGIVIDRIESLGLELVAAKVVNVTQELAQEHYRDLKGQPFFEGIVKFIRGEFQQIPMHRVLALIYEGESAITAVRKIVGSTNPEKAEPWTIRGAFGKITDGIMENIVHASSNSKEAEREIALWFDGAEIVD
ncbi:MAG: nucleoside-diphosphate kinase [Elusimicrobia bacterium]|nr:nucleoside-diphosphate kinase [Elusimicrobiota bacterium]